MSEQSNQQPTREQIRDARHAGFNDSVAHMDNDRRERLTQSFQTQDGRREANIAGFVSTIAGGD